MTFRVLVLCTGNSARSQIGEALLAVRGASRVEGIVTAASAGSRPAPQVNAYAVKELARHGIAWEGRTPKSIDDIVREPRQEPRQEHLPDPFQLVITVCDNAREACPYVPGAFAQVHWGLPDPADETEPAAARAAFARTYDALAARIDALLALPLEQLDAAALKAAAQHIHDTLPQPAHRA